MAAVACLGFTSCTGDLDVKPIDPNMTTEVTPSGLFNTISMAWMAVPLVSFASTGTPTSSLPMRPFATGVMMVFSSSAIILTIPTTRCSMVTTLV